MTNPSVLRAVSAARARYGWIAYCLAAIAVSRVLLFAIGALSRRFSGAGDSPVDLWVNWDAFWYLTIAKDGYAASTHYDGELFGQSNLAFFPLYPLLTRLAAHFLELKVAAVAVANVSLVGACLVLYRFARDRLGESGAQYALLSLLFFPGSFVFSSALTESLFVFLTVSSFYLASKRAYVPAALLAGLATLTRPTGAFVAVALTIDWVRTRLVRPETGVDWRELLAVGMCPMFLLGLMFYELMKFGDAFAFQHIQYFWFRRGFHPVGTFLSGFRSSADPVDTFNAITLLVMVLVILPALRYLTLGEIVFMAIALLIPLGTSLTSMPRYMMGFFMVHVGLGGLMARREGLARILLPVMGMMNGFLMTWWSKGHNVYM